jgi:hypothetical protein
MVFIAILCTPNMVIKMLKINFGVCVCVCVCVCVVLPCTRWGPEVAPRPLANFPNFSRKGSFL